MMKFLEDFFVALFSISLFAVWAICMAAPVIAVQNGVAFNAVIVAASLVWWFVVAAFGWATVRNLDVRRILRD